MDFGKYGDCLEGRLYAIRKDQNLSQEEFGLRIGVTRSAICNYENGTRPINEQIILAVCREFGVDEHWMRSGYGVPYKAKDDGVIAKLISEYKCTNFEGDFLKTYFQMDQKERDNFVDVMYRFLAPFMKNLEGKNPFAEYYDLSVNSDLIYSKSQRERLDNHIKCLEQKSQASISDFQKDLSAEDYAVIRAEIEELKRQNQELVAENKEFRARFEALEKEDEIAEIEQPLKVSKKSDS